MFPFGATILADHRLKAQELTAVSRISGTSIRTVLYDHLCMNKISARSVLFYLSAFQRKRRVEYARSFFNQLIWKSTTTDDETIVLYYDPLFKREYGWNDDDLVPERLQSLN